MSSSTPLLAPSSSTNFITSTDDSLITLPPEILLTIISHITTLQDVLSFAATCHYLRLFLTQNPHALIVLHQLAQKNVIEFNEFLRVVRAEKLGVRESGCFYDETETASTDRGESRETRLERKVGRGSQQEGEVAIRPRGYIDPPTKEGISWALLSGALSITSTPLIGQQQKREPPSKESSGETTTAYSPTYLPPTFSEILSVIKLSTLARRFELAISIIHKTDLGHHYIKPGDDPLEGFRDCDKSTKPASFEIRRGARYRRARLYRAFARWLLAGQIFHWAFEEASELEDERARAESKKMQDNAVNGSGHNGVPPPTDSGVGEEVTKAF